MSFDSPSETAQVFAEFGVTVSDPHPLWTAIANAAKVAADTRSKHEGWIGVHLGNRFFAWDGPLDGLDDKAPLPCPPALTEALTAGG